MDGFKAARDFLLAHRTDHATACRDFRWPEPTHFNWALDWFDAELARGDGAGRPALTIVGEAATSLSFAALSERSSRLANALRALGVNAATACC
jgi:acetyl-CoA synthetase